MEWDEINQTYVRPANEAFENGEIDKTEAKFKEGLAATNNDGFVLLNYAEFLEKCGRIVEANERFIHAEKKLPLLKYRQRARTGIERTRGSIDLGESSRSSKTVLDEELRVILRSPASSVASKPIEHDGLGFRSRSEIRLYEALKTRHVLFFPNQTAVLGGKGLKKEPDFLVCANGKWGILEVMGESYHTRDTATEDHERARMFKDYGVKVIEFYDSGRCYRDPDAVVIDFLNLLSKH